MEDNLSINEFALKFLNGDFDDDSVKTQVDAGWYDWFCADKSLRAKTKNLGNKVLSLMASKKIDNEKQYVFFKNNCPVSGSLYDDFRICDLETGDVIYTIVPRSGYGQRGASEVWGTENNFAGPVVEGSWNDVKNFFGV